MLDLAITGATVVTPTGGAAVDIGVKALKGELPADYPKLVLTKPDVITKENVDKYYRKDAVF